MIRGKSFRVESAGQTNPGKVRELNEDSYLMRPDIGLWVVADGMGGHDAGDFASQTIVKSLGDLDKPETAPALLGALESRVIAANETLRKAALSKGGNTVIGATLVALVVFQDAFACVWSGDSRIYRITRSGAIEQMSRDHTEAQELIDRGTLTREEARNWPRRNVITRAIGVFDTPELEMVQGRLEDGDLFLLCSDGLTEHVEDHEIAEIARARPLSKACDDLIELTLERGAKDNVTVIAVTCRELTQLHPGPAQMNRSAG